MLRSRLARTTHFSPRGRICLFNNSQVRNHSSALTWSVPRQKEEDVSASSPIRPILEKKKLGNVRNHEWRVLYKHFNILRDNKDYNEVLRLGEFVFSKDVNSAPRELYEQMLQTLAEFQDGSTREHSELGLSIFEKYVERGFLNEYRSPEMLHTLYRIVSKHPDPFIKYRYLKITQSIAQPAAKRRKEAIYERLISLHIATNELEGAIDVMREAALNGMGLSYHCNEVLLIALLENGDIDFAWEIVYRLHGAKTIYSRTWGLFISYAAKAYHHDAVEWAWKTAIIPGNIVLDDWCFLRMMEIGKRNGNYGMVRWAFLRYRQRILASEQNIPSTGKNLAPLVEAHAITGEITPAIEIIERLGESASDVSLRDLPEFVQLVSASHENANLLEKKFIALQQDPRSVDAVKTLLYNVILHTIARENIDNALNFYRYGQLKFDVSSNEDTILCMIKVACDQADVLLIDEIITDCQRAKIPLTRRIVEPIVSCLKKNELTNALTYYVKLMESLGIHPRAYM